jgi:hypothetical protein
MPLKRKTIEFEIEHVLELILKSSEQLLFNMRLQEDDIVELSKLVDEELANLTKDQRTDGSFDRENVANFIHNYNLSITELDNAEKLFDYLTRINGILDEKEWECLSNQSYIEEMKRTFSHPKNIISDNPFPEWLKVIPNEKREVLSEKLKLEFDRERGKDIRFLIDILTEYDILSCQSGMLKKVYCAIGEYFNRDIGTYESVRKTISNDPMFKDDYLKIKRRVDSILRDLELNF